jgi:hypothetical protein
MFNNGNYENNSFRDMMYYNSCDFFLDGPASGGITEISGYLQQGSSHDVVYTTNGGSFHFTYNLGNPLPLVGVSNTAAGYVTAALPSKAGVTEITHGGYGSKEIYVGNDVVLYFGVTSGGAKSNFVFNTSYPLIGNGKGMTNLPHLIVRTNWVANQYYTNTLGTPITVSSDEALTLGTIVGTDGFMLLTDPAGAKAWQTNCDGTVNTIVGSVAMTQRQLISGIVTNGGCFVFSNFTTTGSASLVNGKYSY